MKVLVLNLDGYDGWTAGYEEVIDLPSFTEEAICDLLMEEGEMEEGETLSVFKVTETDHSISVMGEEGGQIYIKMD